MDPNANLAEQITIAKTIHSEEIDNLITLAINAGRLAELILSLNEWIQLNGALPDLWKVGRQ